MSSEYSSCPQSAVYVPRVQFMSQSTDDHRVYVLREVSSLSSKVQFMALDYTLCPNSQSIVYILRAQFSSTENSLCP